MASSVTLFKDVLCYKESNKLKKLQVKLKQWISDEGKTVFNLNIQGIHGHNCHLHFDFTEQEICFLRIEEHQDTSAEQTCFPCFRRSSFSGNYYCRLVLLLYRQANETGGESQCVKVPLIQSGNIHAATTLRRLQKVITTHIIDPGDVQHWLVSVITCGHLSEGDSVFLCVTKYAIAIVMCGQYQIMHYHPFYGTELSVTCDREENIIKIDAIDGSKERHVTENDNFTFARQYVFRTSACGRVERSIKNMLRLSTLNPQGPSAHWNIRHSELSTSGVVPGTTSDNMVIVPHRPHEFDNNNTGSSGSTGHISSGKLSNIDPQPPFHPYHQSGSGAVGNFSTGSNGPFLSNTSRNFSVDLSLDLKTSDELVATGTSASQLERQFSHQHESFPSPCQHLTSGQSTDPTRQTSRASPIKSCQGFFEIDCVPLSSDTYWSFLPETEDDNLPPPPPPCSAQLQPHVNIAFKHKLPTPHSPINQQTPESTMESAPAESGLSGLMRSISFRDKSNINSHTYINLQFLMSSRRNVHDDSPYYRFYMNVGYITTSKKLKRRNRMSKELREIDFNKLENHEEWFDFGFKEREKDLRFCRINNMNIKATDSENQSIYGYSHAGTMTRQDDDPYWSSDLSLTLQKVLQDEQGMKSELFQKTMHQFDLTREQLISIQVLLSLVPSENNWKQMAEYIGLTNSDVSVIHHFCFTYRELAASIVLIHWMRLYERGKCELKSDYHNLQKFLGEIQRDDLMNVLVNENVSSNVNADEFEEVTHF